MTATLTIETFPNEAAADYIRGKAVADPTNFGNLPAQLKQRAFAVAGIEQMDVLKRLRDTIAKLPEGTSWDEAKRELAAEISPFTGGDNKAAKARAGFMLRTHGFQAYAVARHQQQMEVIKSFPYWKYETVGDSRVRAGHAALDGKVLRADDPWWQTHYPPWDWGCRCIVVPLDEEDAMELGVTDGKQMPMPGRSETFTFDPTNVGVDIDKYHNSKRFQNNPADWQTFFVNPAKNVMTEAPDGRSMNMWQYSLEQKALKMAKALSEGTNAIEARFETAATISGKTGDQLTFALGDKSHTDIKIPQDEDAIVVHTHPSGSSKPSYDDLQTFLDIANGREMFHYIAGVPHPKTGKPIRVRRVVVTGKRVPDALLAEMKELDAQLHSKDEPTRSVARLQKYALMQRLKDEGCVEWETEL
jgi:SPP1 gp7 family putative phage head morphogenesis protein